MGPRVRSANNLAIEAAILAVARAHARLPGVDVTRAKALAARIDGVMAGAMTAECVVALVIQLLRAIGVTDAADESRIFN